MVTIHNLEVTVDVAGDGDEATFARLFALHIETWSRRADDERRRRRQLDADSALGGRRAADDGSVA